MASVYNTNDIVLMDLDGESDFYIHPTRAFTKSTTALINPEIEEIGIQSETNLQQLQLESVAELTEIPTSAIHFLIQKWTQWKPQINISFNWTILEAWNKLAYLTCTVPARMHLNPDTQNYEVKSCIVQMILCGCQNLFSLVGALLLIPKLFISLKKSPPNPFDYIKMGGYIAKAIAKFLFTHLNFFQSNRLLAAHNLDTQPGDVGISMRSRKSGMTTFALFGTYLLLTLTVEFSINVYDFDESFEWGISEILQAYSCYAKQNVLWIERDDCPSDYVTELYKLSHIEALWGLLGLLLFLSGSLLKQNLLLLICASVFLLLNATISLQRNITGTGDIENANGHVQASFNFLKILSTRISEFIGPVLLSHLIDVAFTLPTVLQMMFRVSNTFLIILIFQLSLVFTSIIAACVSSIYIDQIKDMLAEPSQIDSLPTENRALAGFFYKLKASVGIGFQGLFVLNFRFLLWYMGIVGGFIMVLYDTEKDKLAVTSAQLLMSNHTT